MANFLDYLNGGEPEKDKETIEDVGAKDLLNRILAELISLHETVEDLTDIVTDLKEKNANAQVLPQGNVQPLMTEPNSYAKGSKEVNPSFNENLNSPIQVSGAMNTDFTEHVGELFEAMVTESNNRASIH